MCNKTQPIQCTANNFGIDTTASEALQSLRFMVAFSIFNTSHGNEGKRLKESGNYCFGRFKKLVTQSVQNKRRSS